MATTPTSLPIPSEDPRDLKFNAGKLDEVMTSTSYFYTDRFGVRRWTIAGINYTANQAISQFGYITLDSFQAGAPLPGNQLKLPNQVLRDTSTGEYYRWDGAFPKTVPAGSTPASTGGVGIGSWLSVGDASLRSNLISSNTGLGDALVAVKQPFTGSVIRTQHEFNYQFPSVMDAGAKGDGVTDDTAAFTAARTAFPNGVYVPAGTYLIPSDIFGKFWGPGKRIQAIGGDPIPFTNPAQTHGNLFLGYDSGKSYAGNDITGRVVGLGTGACRNVTTGTNITTIGHGTISGDTLADALTDTSPCTGTELIGIGVNALKKAITLNNSIGIGRDALNENKFGSFNVGIGSSSFQQLHTGSNNVGVGRSTGMRAGIVYNSDGTQRLSFTAVNGCTFIGNAAGREITSGDSNTYVGNNAGRGVTSTTNSFTGTATGSNNVALGADALNAIGTASNNVMLGRGAGRTLSSGTNNIFIGDLAGAGVTSSSNRLIIGGSGSLPHIEGNMAGSGDANNVTTFDSFIRPASDGNRTNGTASNRWSTVFAATGTINTSDGRFKTDVTDIEEAERKVAQKLKAMMRKFRFTDAVDEKGGKARWHFGVIAQDVQQAFADEGLDAHEYGLFCHDTWETEYVPVMAKKTVIDDETGIESEVMYDTGDKKVHIEGGDRYGIRYEELLCFIIAAI